MKRMNWNNTSSYVIRRAGLLSKKGSGDPFGTHGNAIQMYQARYAPSGNVIAFFVTDSRIGHIWLYPVKVFSSMDEFQSWNDIRNSKSFGWVKAKALGLWWNCADVALVFDKVDANQLDEYLAQCDL